MSISTSFITVSLSTNGHVLNYADKTRIVGGMKLSSNSLRCPVILTIQSPFTLRSSVEPFS